MARDDTKHADRLTRANERADTVLSCKLASDPDVTTMGTRISATVTTQGVSKLTFPAVDQEALAVLAIYARPFTLQKDGIRFDLVAQSLSHFACGAAQTRITGQLDRLHKACEAPRARFFVNVSDRETVPGGMTDVEVGDSVLYWKVAHAKSPGELVRSLPTAHQWWALQGLVGDWAALIAHQQYVTHRVRPDICPQLTPWAGTHLTIFDRISAEVTDLTER